MVSSRYWVSTWRSSFFLDFKTENSIGFRIVLYITKIIPFAWLFVSAYCPTPVCLQFLSWPVVLLFLLNQWAREEWRRCAVSARTLTASSFRPSTEMAHGEMILSRVTSPNYPLGGLPPIILTIITILGENRAKKNHLEGEREKDRQRQTGYRINFQNNKYSMY